VTVLAPETAPGGFDPLIGEARERALRRRRAYAIAAAAVALGVGAGALATRGLKGGGATSVVSPRPQPALHRVQARGPVQHWVTEPLFLGPKTIDLATGRARTTRVRLETWRDQKTGFERQITTYDGRLVSVDVQQTCRRFAPSRVCSSATPWAEAGALLKNSATLTFPLARKAQAFARSPGSSRFGRVVGRGRFHGRRVLWTEGVLRDGTLNGEQVALDARTHELVATRSVGRGVNGYGAANGRVMAWGSSFTMFHTLPAHRVAFTVPQVGGGQVVTVALDESDFDRAGALLGQAPLWVGESFHGHRLRSVEIGMKGLLRGNSQRIASSEVPFVRLDYGTFRLDEFGRERPPWFRNAPAPGTAIAMFSSGFWLSRGGVLVHVAPSWPQPLERIFVSPHDVRPAWIVAIARALRPAR
jgi:hypothetical protein